MRISDWSSDVCSSDLGGGHAAGVRPARRPPGHRRSAGATGVAVHGRGRRPRLALGRRRPRAQLPPRHRRRGHDGRRVGGAVLRGPRRPGADRRPAPPHPPPPPPNPTTQPTPPPPTPGPKPPTNPKNGRTAKRHTLKPHPQIAPRNPSSSWKKKQNKT